MKLAALVWLAGTAAASAQPVFEEQRVAVEGDWRRSGEMVFVEFPSPRADFRHHARLAINGLATGANLTLNGRPLQSIPGFRGQYDVSDYLDPRGNKLVITGAAPPENAVLLITPRVFFHSQRMEIAGGEVRAAASVRNTLENTVNVTLSFVLKGAGGEELGQWTVDATVPPGTTQDVSARGPLKQMAPRGAEALVSMDKAEEAMEPAYRFRAIARLEVRAGR